MGIKIEGAFIKSSCDSFYILGAY